MKPRFSLPISVLFVLSALPGVLRASVLVAGVMQNAYLNDRIELRIPHYYIDGRSDTPMSFVDDQHRFSIQADITEPQIVFLIHNEDRLPIFLEPNDTLFVETDMFQFPLTVTLSGRAAHNNRLLKKFLQENPQDFNEFNNLRYKIGTWWTTVETDMDRRMDELAVPDFRQFMDKRKVAAFALLDEYSNQNPGRLSPAFKDFLSAEILYDWAYHLLFYGNIYKTKHAVEPAFFEFLYDAPTASDLVGCEPYRRFLLTYMAWKQAQSGDFQHVYSDQYLAASDFLNQKSLAFFRSEILMLGLKAEQYSEVLPHYTSFLQNNPHPAFDYKITDLYEKAVRVRPGTPAPGFSGKDFFGNDLSLDRFRGKVVYLNFWATWCAACLKKMNFMDEFAADFNREGIVVVNVSTDEDVVRWNNVIGEEQFRGLHIMANAPEKSGGPSIAKLYNVEAIPQYFIIGKDGTFAEKGWSNQPDDIRKHLLELTKNP